MFSLCRSYVIRPSSKLLCRTSGSQQAKDDTPLRRLLDDSSSFGEIENNEPELQWATEPYVTTQRTRQGVARVEPDETTIVLFPGQGSQFVGMGRRLLQIPAVKDLYELASSIVGWDVARLCTEGPESELTARCQTAVVVTSLAALELAREERPTAMERVRAAAGFSLGELTALVFADALPFEPALRLVGIREAAMRAAAAERPGGMLTVWLAADGNLPHALLRAREHAAERGIGDPICEVANYLYPNCKVVAGDEVALKFVESNGAKFGVRRSARVQVSGAFHTRAMRRAGDAVREAVQTLGAEGVRAPRVPVVSGVEGRALVTAEGVRRAIWRAVAAPVRWEQTLHALYARPRGDTFPLTVALGPGGALRSTLRQVNARAWDRSIVIDV